MTVSLTITRNTGFRPVNGDTDNDGVADPGEVLRTILRITNTGTTNALGLNISDALNGSTLDGASVRITPIAADDTLAQITGNAPVRVTQAQLLTNDLDPDGGATPALKITAINGTSIVDGSGNFLVGTVVNIGSGPSAGSRVTVLTGGELEVQPATGFNGNLTFNYTVTDAQGLTNVGGFDGVVTIPVSGFVWFVDPSYAGANGTSDGSFLRPYTSFNSLNDAGQSGQPGGADGIIGDDDVDGANDTIFVYDRGPTAVSGGITLEAGQKLYGDGHSFVVNGIAIGASANNATISYGGGGQTFYGVTLATDNEVRGLNLVGGANSAVGIQDGNGSVTTVGGTLTISGVAISGAGQAIDIDQGGNLAINISSLSTTGSTSNAVQLAGTGSSGTGLISGTANLGSGAISGATGSAFLLGVAGGTIGSSGGTVNVSYSGTIESTGGSSLLEIQDRTGGSVTLDGNMTQTSGTVSGIIADGNAGTTVLLGVPSIAISSGAATGISLTNNTGSSFSHSFLFGGNGVDIVTTSGTGLVFTGGGTLSLNHTSNSIQTTTGQIANIANGTSGGISFQSLSSTGTVANTALLIDNLDGSSFNANSIAIAGTSGATSDGIRIQGGSSTNFSLGNVTIGATGNGGVELNGANGTVTFDSLGINGSAGNGLEIVNATNTVTVTSGAIGNTNDPGAAGVLISGGSANVNIGASITKTSGDPLVSVTGGHATGTVTFSGNHTATSGGAGGYSFNNADGTYNFTGTNTLGGSAGISITNGSSGTFSWSSGTTINHSASGDAVTISGSTPNVTFNGTITDGNGRPVNIDDVDGGTITFGGTISGTSQGIRIANSNGGTVNFNGQTTLNTGANTALDFVTGNSNKAVNFYSTGAVAGNGLDITTSNATGISASGVTLTVQGAGHTISTGTGANGTAVNINGTNAVGGSGIGAQGVRFDTINTNGATNAIVLNGTSGGSFSVTGTGAANSGGTLTNSVSDAVIATNAGGLSFDRVNITNTGGHGINATNLGGNSGFQNGSMTNWGTDAGPNNDGIRIVNTTAALNNFVVTGATFTGNALSNDGIFMETQGSGNMRLTVSNSTFTQMYGDGIQVNGTSTATATMNVVITNNQFTNASPITGGDPNGGNGGISINPFGPNTFFVDINGNTFTDIMRPVTNLGAIGITSGGPSVGAQATADITIRNNTLNDINGARGITATVDGGTTRLTIDNNNIDNLGSTSKTAINVNATNNAGAGTVGNVDVAIRNNDIGQNGPLWTTGSGGTTEAVFLTNSAGATMRALIENNIISANTSVEAIRARAAGTGLMSVTIRNNTVTDTDAARGGRQEIEIATGTIGTDANATVNASISGNTISAGGFIILNEGTSGTGTADLNVQQASSAALSTANSNATVTIQNQTVDFGQAAPALPNNATLPSAPALLANPLPLAAAQPLPVDEPASAPPEDEANAPAANDVTPPAAPADAGGTPPVLPDAPAPSTLLAQAQLDVIVAAAIERWIAAGASAEQVAAMRAASVSVADMVGVYLGSSQGGAILIDVDGAGIGWFVDATPGADEEFAGQGTRLTADEAPAAGRIDLLTVVLHELAHQAGLDDTYLTADRDNLMYGYMYTGERRLPYAGQLTGALPGAVAHEAFALGPIAVGTLPAGKAVEIIYDHAVNAFANQVIATPFTNQASVTGTNFTAANIVSNQSETLVVDTLTLGNLVFRDVNRNGVFDAGDTGVAGVALSLFADANNDDTPDGAAIATTTTAAGGLYSFANLAPGNYIVRVDAGNFGAGQALVGLVRTTVAADPDNNTDNDSNGAPSGPFTQSPAITLAYNTEPTAGAGNDTNTTLDFGFVSPNAAPVLANLQGDSVTFTEDGAAVLADAGSNAAVADTDSPDFNGGSLRIEITQNRVGAEDRLQIAAVGSVTTSGGSVLVGGVAIGTFTGGTGDDALVISFNADATPARVQSLVRAITYSNSNTANPSTAARTLTFTLNDGDGNAFGGNPIATATSTVTVVAVNDSPTFTAASATLASALEDTAPLGATISSLFGAIYSDPDNPAETINGIAVQGNTANAGTQGVWQYSTNSGLNWFDVGSVSSSAALLLGASSLLRFLPVANYNGTPPSLLVNAVDASYGGSFTSGSARQTPNLGSVNYDSASAIPLNTSITPVNDAPTLTSAAAAPSYTENAPGVQIAGNVTLNDVDNASFAGGTLTAAFTSGATAGDAFGIALSAELTNPSSGVYAFNGANFASVSALTATSITFSLNADATQAAVRALIEGFVYLSQSENPTATPRQVTFTLNDGGGTANGGSNIGTLARTVSVTPVDDAPVAVADSASVAENATVVVTGASDDTDVDGGPRTVVQIAGTNAMVGTAVTLPSGARATLNADGTISYDPNGRFNWLVSPTVGGTTGAVSSTTDSFTYTLNGGSSASVTVTITGVTGAGDQLRGTGANNSLTGTGGGDFIDVSQGGDDSVNAGDGNDGIFFGAAFTGADAVNGGDGLNDQLGLQGNYGAGLTLGAAQLQNVEVVALLPTAGAAYSITTLDDLVAADVTMTFFAAQLAAGQNFTFDGSAETAGAFRIYGGLGADVITTGAGNDGIYFGDGRFNPAADRVNGGAGTNDQLALDGNYSGLTLDGTMVQNVELLALLEGRVGIDNVYDVTLADSLATGPSFTVYAVGTRGGVIANGSLETAANLTMFGGLGSDTLIGGGGADRLVGNAGNDVLRGNGGADRFEFQGAALGAGNVDAIADFVSGTDQIYLQQALFAALGAGGVPEAAFLGGAGVTAATTVNHRILYNSTTGALFYDPDGTGAAAAVQFATLTGAPTLVHTDFIVFTV